MTPPTTAEAEATAPATAPQSEIEAARGQVERLHEAATQGQNVTARQLADARDAVDLAELKEEGRKQREAQEREAARLARIEEVRRAWREDLGKEEITAARDSLLEQMKAFARLCADYNAKRWEIFAPVFDGSGWLDPLPRGWKDYGHAEPRPSIDGVEINPMDARQELENLKVMATRNPR